MRFQLLIASVLALSIALITGGYVLAQSDSRGSETHLENVAATSDPATPGERIWHEGVSLRSASQGNETELARLLFRYPDGGPVESLASSLPLVNPADIPPYLPGPYLDPRFLLMEAAALGLEGEGAVVESEKVSEPESGEINAVPTHHIVEPGDTLWAIGLQYGTPWPVLAEINALPNPHLIFPGQVIALPRWNSDATDAVIAAAAEAIQEETVYTIQPGDTLSGIGERFGLSWPLLARWNRIANPDLIYAGDRLSLVDPGDGPPASLARSLARPSSQVVTSPASSRSGSVPLPLSVSQPAAAGVPQGEVVIQSGIATWYGPGFEGNMTACGQVYFSSQLTAASNTLPCGSVVTVTNQYTGASVTVTITDRGGFSHALDLSHAAFSAIASPSAGVIPVIISAAK